MPIEAFAYQSPPPTTKHFAGKEAMSHPDDGPHRERVPRRIERDREIASKRTERVAYGLGRGPERAFERHGIPACALDRERSVSKVRLPRGPGAGARCARLRTPRELTDAHDQSAHSSRPRSGPREDGVAGPQGVPAEARRLRPRLHDHAEEAELGPPQGLPRAPDERHGGHVATSRAKGTTCRSTRSCSSAAAA